MTARVLPLLLLGLPALAAGASRIARIARVNVANDSLIVGQPLGRAAEHLDCPESPVQRTIRRCRLKEDRTASSLGQKVSQVTLNAHFQGDVINMAVEFAPGIGVDALLAALKAALGKDPKIDYWADDSHLYASHIWIDKEAEVEVTRTVRGASDGVVRFYASSLSGNRPLSPQDRQAGVTDLPLRP